MAAIANSAHLCRVTSSNAVIMDSPFDEAHRISRELENRCGVPIPPFNLTQEIADAFIDPSLQHHGNNSISSSSKGDQDILSDYNGCTIYKYDSKHDKGSDEEMVEANTYIAAMKIFCDLESGKAYEESYVWPNLTPWSKKIRKKASKDSDKKVESEFRKSYEKCSNPPKKPGSLSTPRNKQTASQKRSR